MQTYFTYTTSQKKGKKEI